MSEMDESIDVPNAAALLTNIRRTSTSHSRHGDNDSAYGEDGEVYTSTKRTTKCGSRLEYGRTYHTYKDGKYHLPNDEIEADRLDLQHELYKLTLNNKLFLAPIGDHVQEVLDVGTGTGIWAIEIAEQFPSARVIGTDLSPLAPTWVPPNCTFLVDDSEENWVFSQKFDFIHGRMLTVAMRDWPRYFQQCYENMKPGGWVEMQDLRYPVMSDDGTLAEDGPMKKWSYLMFEAGTRAGHQLDSCSRYAQQMADAGFINIHQDVFKWAMNPWPKDEKDKTMGLWTMTNFLEGVAGFTMAYFVRHLGWSPEDVQVFLVDVRKELKDQSKHGYFPIHVVYGQKPEAKPTQDPSQMPFAEQSHHVAAPTEMPHVDQTQEFVALTEPPHEEQSHEPVALTEMQHGEQSQEIVAPTEMQHGGQHHEAEARAEMQLEQTHEVLAPTEMQHGEQGHEGVAPAEMSHGGQGQEFVALTEVPHEEQSLEPVAPTEMQHEEQNHEPVAPTEMQHEEQNQEVVAPTEMHPEEQSQEVVAPTDIVMSDSPHTGPADATPVPEAPVHVSPGEAPAAEAPAPTVPIEEEPGHGAIAHAE